MACENVSIWHHKASHGSLSLRSYKGKVNIATIVYLHRIIDNRMSGSQLKNLKMFRTICGQEAMPNVVIATTMWSRLGGSHAEGEMREAELIRGYWADMIAQGCRVERFQDTCESAWHIIGHKGFAKVQIPREMVDDHLQLKQTEAGITLNNELTKLLQARKDASRRLRAQLKNQDNELIVQELKQLQTEIDERITQTASELEELNIPLASQLLAFFPKGGRVCSATVFPSKV
jgi:hypothetical protein